MSSWTGICSSTCIRRIGPRWFVALDQNDANQPPARASRIRGCLQQARRDSRSAGAATPRTNRRGAYAGAVHAAGSLTWSRFEARVEALDRVDLRSTQDQARL